MKKTQIIFASALVLALLGVTHLRAVEEGRKDGKATVRSVHGTVEYLDGAIWKPVKPNMRFAPGVTVRAGPDGLLDMSVNGLASAVRLTNATILQIPSMSYVGTVAEGDTTTRLNLKSGSVLSIVKKISANSTYEIQTPRGVAGIRGTMAGADTVSTDNNPDHNVDTLYCFNGKVHVIPNPNGNGAPQKTWDLSDLTQVQIGGPKPAAVGQMDSQTIQNFQSAGASLTQTINNSINNGNAGGVGGNQGNGNGNVQPYTPPQGEPAS